MAVSSVQRSPQPFFTVAAWLSLVAPLLAGAWAFYVGSAPPHLSKADLVVVTLVSGAAFISGCVSLWGIKSNGALVILPPALLGILASAVLEVLALIFLILSNLPGP